MDEQRNESLESSWPGTLEARVTRVEVVQGFYLRGQQELREDMQAVKEVVSGLVTDVKIRADRKVVGLFLLNALLGLAAILVPIFRS